MTEQPLPPGDPATGSGLPEPLGHPSAQPADGSADARIVAVGGVAGVSPPGDAVVLRGVAQSFFARYAGTTLRTYRSKLLAYAAATVLEAGSDTTASMLQTILLLMLANPECIQNAREELDRVVGPDRLPTFDDFDQLPYVVACIKEAMRRRPIIPLGVYLAYRWLIQYNLRGNNRHGTFGG